MIEKTVEEPLSQGSSNPWTEVPFVAFLPTADRGADALSEDPALVRHGRTAASESSWSRSLRVVTELPSIGRLRKPIVARLYLEDGAHIAECPELEAVECGRNEEEALEKLLQLVAEDFAHWTGTDDAKLTPQAQDLKRKYLALRQ